uniref:Delta-like protein n=1 Tax=Parastrongyloides trichosuri TaxID=131310 RepID=A0A0N4ZA36_PARTI
MRIRTILIFLLISIYLHLSSSKGIFEVKLVSFISKNIYPIELSICLKEYQTVVEDTGDCRFGKKILNLTKGYLDSERSGNDSYTFLFPFDMPWPKSHSIIIKGRVKDEDDKNEKDSTIIVYKESFLLSGKSNWNVEVITNNNVSMSFLYRIRCDTNYYGMDCSKMCQGAIFGTEHFECDEDGNHICKEGWIGKRCDQPVCKNGCSSSGKCVAPDTCDCFNGYSGKNCEQCIPLPGCQNGYCKNKGNECICEEGWTGHFCEINLVPCKTKNKCKNGGICLNDKDDIIKCECPNGFFGKYCQFKKPTCETHQCKNGGTCVMTSDGSESKPICDCLPMYFGKYCQSEKNLEEDIDIIAISTTEKSLMLQNNNNRTVSLLSRNKSSKPGKIPLPSSSTTGNFDLEEFLLKRDYYGAISMLEYQLKLEPNNIDNLAWLGHCAFHAGEYKKASKIYENILKLDNAPSETEVHLGCCYFFLGMHMEAKEVSEKGEKSDLQNRLLFHVAHKLGEEKKLMFHHSKLKDTIEDQLCLASMHYLRMHYQEAIDIYKKIILSNKNFVALNIFLALCYYKLDYYDISLQVLQIYLQAHPDSVTAINLAAANKYRLHTPEAAQNEIRPIMHLLNSETFFGKDLLRHNNVVFKRGQGALQVLPSLVDTIPEAKINIIIFHLKRDDVLAAYGIIKNMEPQVAQEYILKAITFTLIGYENKSTEHIKEAIELFKLVGESQTECDTISGRQCMASSKFLQQNFEEVLLYLNSIKSFFVEDNIFNFNFGQALMGNNEFKEADEALRFVKGDLTDSSTYQYCMLKCLINNKKINEAEDFLRRLNKKSLFYEKSLSFFANECYKTGQYHAALPVFISLRNINGNSELTAAVRGCCIGIVKMFVEGKVSKDELNNAHEILYNEEDVKSRHALNIINKWREENNIKMI